MKQQVETILFKRLPFYFFEFHPAVDFLLWAPIGTRGPSREAGSNQSSLKKRIKTKLFHDTTKIAPRNGQWPMAAEKDSPIDRSEITLRYFLTTSCELRIVMTDRKTGNGFM